MREEIFPDYRMQLQLELERRKLSNPNFSLRSFARVLKVSPAFLSKVLRGQKHLSVANAAQVAARLQYSPRETRSFCQQVQIARAPESVRAVMGRTDSKGPLDDAIKLELDAFQAIADWYHLAIRELATFKGFKADPLWISTKLGIQPSEASQALQRLERLGLLKKRGSKWVPDKGALATPSEQPSHAIRRHHSQMMEKARRALDEQNVNRRSITGTVIPISRDKMDAAKNEIRKFHSRMLKLLDSSSPNEVYQLNVQFFALTEEEKL